MENREKLRELFKREFAHWEIELAPGAKETDDVWLVVKAGWTIWTKFGVADDGRAYLDYYANHRMTNDRHVRLYADGKHDGLPTIQSWCVVGKEEERDAHNQEVEKLLNEKGFVMTGDAHPSAQVNRELIMGRLGNDKEDPE